MNQEFTQSGWSDEGLVVQACPSDWGYVGHSFLGWNTQPDGTGQGLSIGGTVYPTSSISLYAQWESNTYTVSYSGNGATGGATTSTSHIYDVPSPLANNGFVNARAVTFDANGGSCDISQIEFNLPFIYWTDGQATYSEGENVMNLTSVDGGVVDLGASWGSAQVTLPSASLVDNVFNGWYTDPSDGEKVGDGEQVVGLNSTITLYAHWSVPEPEPEPEP